MAKVAGCYSAENDLYQAIEKFKKCAVRTRKQRNILFKYSGNAA